MNQNHLPANNITSVECLLYASCIITGTCCFIVPGPQSITFLIGSYQIQIIVAGVINGSITGYNKTTVFSLLYNPPRISGYSIVFGPQSISMATYFKKGDSLFIYLAGKSIITIERSEYKRSLGK